MGANANIPSLNLLERLDLALAARAVTSVPDVAGLTEGQRLPSPPTTAAKHWVSGILGLRGLLVHPDDVERITGSEKFEDLRLLEAQLLLGLSVGTGSSICLQRLGLRVVNDPQNRHGFCLDPYELTEGGGTVESDRFGHQLRSAALDDFARMRDLRRIPGDLLVV